MQVNFGAGYSNLSGLNGYLSNNGIKKVDKIDYDRELGLLISFQNGLVFRGGFSIKEFLDNDDTTRSVASQSVYYKQSQFHFSMLKQLIEIKRFSAIGGLGLVYSNSTFSYFSNQSTPNNFIVNNSNKYFSMYSYANLGIKVDLAFYYKVYQSKKTSNQLLIGLNTGYIFMFKNNEWINSAGYTVSNVPKINSNNIYGGLSLLYNFQLCNGGTVVTEKSLQRKQ